MSGVPASSHGGGGLPTTWTTDAAGNVIVAPSAGAAGGVGDIHIVAPADASDCISGTDSTHPTSAHWAIDQWGYMSAEGASFDANSNDVGDVTVLKATGTAGGGEVRDLLQVANLSVPRRVRVIRSGHLLIAGANAAPADGDLAAGDCAFWFDKTNGAAKFMLKGKTTDGTVVAASVVMA